MSQRVLADCANEWIRHCKTCNYANATVDYYYNTLHNFYLFFHPSNTLDQIDTSLIQEYIIYLQGKGIQDTTIRTYLSGLRTILYYFMERNWMDKFKITVPKSREKIKEIYTDDELLKLLKKPNLKTCTFAEYRNWVLVNYLCGSGQRANSVINIKIKDVDFFNGIVRLEETKNKKQTLLPLSQSLLKILDDYLVIRKGDPNDYLFCTEFGTQMTRSALSSSIRTYNLKRGVDKTSIHLFRHTFATKWVRQNGDIVKLQHLLCHNDIKTTQKYLNMTLSDLQEDYEEMNPLETLLKKNCHKIKI